MVTARFYLQTQKLEPLYQTPSFTLTVKGFKLCPGSREFDLCLCGVGNLNWKFLVYFLCKMGWFTGQDLHRSVQTLSNKKKFRGSYCNYMQLFTEYSNEFHVIILAQWDGNLNSLAEKIKMPWVLPKLIGAMYTRACTHTVNLKSLFKVEISRELNAGLCSSSTQWPLEPNFFSWATWKSEFFHTNHMLGTLNFTSSEHWAPFNLS